MCLTCQFWYLLVMQNYLHQNSVKCAMPVTDSFHLFHTHTNPGTILKAWEQALNRVSNCNVNYHLHMAFVTAHYYHAIIVVNPPYYAVCTSDSLFVVIIYICVCTCTCTCKCSFIHYVILCVCTCTCTVHCILYIIYMYECCLVVTIVRICM